MQAIILAAGMGKRMKSTTAKCAQLILDTPLITYLTTALKKKKIQDIFVVVGYHKEDIISATQNEFIYIEQEKPLGTADAVKCCLPYLSSEYILIMPGDTIVLEDSIYTDLVNHHMNEKNDMTILTIYKENPQGYGRIIREQNKIRIVEQVDLKDEVSNECNSGIYLISTRLLQKFLPKIAMNSRGEYYFTDICSLLSEYQIGTVLSKTPILGINTVEELLQASHLIQQKTNLDFIKQGVIIQNAETTFISPDSFIAEGTYIGSGSEIYHSRIDKNNKIIGSCRILNSAIGEDNSIENSIIEHACIGRGNRIGPFSHFRLNTDIGNFNRIGNFVELKDTLMASHTNVAHLAYLGNCECGSHINFGCGSITVNFNGKEKHKTIIKDNAFIGCNSNLIAPIIIHENAFIAAGSTITSNVDENSLAIARARQITKEGYFKNNKKDLPTE